MSSFDIKLELIPPDMHVCKFPLETRAYFWCNDFRDSAGILIIRIKNPFYRFFLLNKTKFFYSVSRPAALLVQLMILRFMQAVNVMETVNLVLRSGNVENISSANLIFLALSGGWKGPFDFPFLFCSRPNFSRRTSAETLATQASPTRI